MDIYWMVAMILLITLIAPHIHSHLKRVKGIKAELTRYKDWVADLQSGMFVNCVYCGHRYGPKKDTPVSMADILKQHIETCPTHPMSALRQQMLYLSDLTANLLASQKGTLKTTNSSECQLCGKATNNLTGDPSLWQVDLFHPNQAGTLVAYHMGCVSRLLQDCLTPTDTALEKAPQ